MKKIFNITIILLLALIFTNRVYAETGDACRGSVKIKETAEATTAKFKAVLPMCDTEEGLIFDGYQEYETKETYPEARDMGRAKVEAYYRTLDNKSVGVTSVPRCDNKIAYIKNTFSITVTKKSTIVGYHQKKEEVWKCKDICSDANVVKCKDAEHKDYCQWYDGKSPVPMGNANMSGLTRTSATSGPVIEPQCLKIQDKCGWEETGGYVNDTDRPIIGCGDSKNHPASEWTYDPSAPENEACSITDTLDAYNCVDDHYYYDEEETNEEKKCKKITTSEEQKIKDEQVKTVSKDPNVRASAAKAVCRRDYIFANRPEIPRRRGDRYIIIDDRGTTLEDYLLEKNDGKYECHNPISNFWFNCPKYHCEATAKTISACTPSFMVEGTDVIAYCVNPGEGFAEVGEHASAYKIDLDFDASACESSHSTVECGYASIIIEGNAKGLDPKAIELALRLWSVHTGQSGFSGVGLSLRTGESCNEGAWYMSKGGVLYNVYEQTYEAAMKDFFSRTWEEEIKPGSTYGFSRLCSDFTKRRESRIDGKNIYDLNDHTKYGVACRNSGSENNVSEQAIALLFQAINGNKDMKAHISEFFRGASTAEPGFATIELPGEDGHNRVVVSPREEEDYRTLSYWGDPEVENDIEIDCTKLERNDPHYDEIAPYCHMKVYILGPDGNVLEGGEVTKCEKDIGCTYVTKGSYAMCDRERTPLYETPEKLIVVYKRPIRSGTIKRFVSCAGTQNQYLYALDYQGAVQTIELPEEEGESYREVLGIKQEETYKAFETIVYHCIGGEDEYCYINNDSAVKADIKTTCNDDFNNFGGSFKSSVKDPSLKCIVHANDQTTKATYDYTSYFNVNSNMCRVYCSDEVEYVMADKVKTTSGRPFVYDVRSSSLSLHDETNLLSSVVREKRTCVSETYYHTPFPVSSVLALRRTYGLTDRELPIGSNWQDLLDRLIRKAWTENNRGENVNQIIYDLYNCNFYKPTNSNGDFGQITRPTTYPKEQTAYEIIHSIYSVDNNLGLVSCSGGIDTCVVHNDIEYEFGGTPDGKDISMNTVGANTATFGGIRYCAGDNCFKYTSTEGKTGDELERIERSNYTYSGSSFKTTSYVQSPNRCTHVTGLKNMTERELCLPRNDYVLFDVSVELGFYNSSELWYEPMSGDVLNRESLRGRGVNNPDIYMRVDPYSFTTDILAYNKREIEGDRVCETRTDSTGTEWNRCKINQTFGNVSTFFRKNPYDLFSSAVKENRTFGCYVDLDVPAAVDCRDAEKCVRYRNADAGKLFPNNIEIPDNWSTPTGQAAIEYIESNSQHIAFNNDLLEFSITLNPTQIKNIQEESNRNGYVEEGMVPNSCQKVYVEGDVQVYADCRSVFLDELRANSAGGDSSKGTLNYDIRYDTENKKKKERIPNVCYRDGPEEDRFSPVHCLY